MAYLDRNAPNNRAAVLTAVALIHAAAGYAIVTGLAVDYYKEITTVFEARNIPADPLAPPPEPKPQPSAKPVEQRVVTAERPLELPTRNRTAVEQRQDILPPVPFPTGDADIFVPMPPPPAPVPTGTPRAAKPQGRPGSWVTTNDYPARDLREGNQGTSRFLLEIGSDGRVQSCTITGSSGFAGLDRTTCERLRTRARFEAATDGGGNRIAGSYAGSITWKIPE